MEVVQVHEASTFITPDEDLSLEVREHEGGTILECSCLQLSPVRNLVGTGAGEWARRPDPKENCAFLGELGDTATPE